jgi:hypothetical protein
VKPWNGSSAGPRTSDDTGHSSPHWVTAGRERAGRSDENAQAAGKHP